MEKIIEEMTQLKISNATMATALQMIVDVCDRVGCRCDSRFICSMCEAKALAKVGLGTLRP